MHNTYDDLQLMVSDSETELKDKIKKEFEKLFDIAREKKFKFDEKEMGGWEYWDRMTFKEKITLPSVNEDAVSIAQCTNEEYYLTGEIHYVEERGPLEETNYPITDLSTNDMLSLYDAMLETLDLK